MSMLVVELNGNDRALFVTCDDSQSDGCRLTHETQVRLPSRGGDVHHAITQAVANGWQRVPRADTLIDICPACTTSPPAS